VRDGCCVTVEEETHEAPETQASKDETEIQVGVPRFRPLSREAA
jgi:hypothetical protein